MLFTIVLHLLGAGPYRTLHVRTPSVGFMFIVYRPDIDSLLQPTIAARGRAARRGAARRHAQRAAVPEPVACERMLAGTLSSVSSTRIHMPLSCQPTLAHAPACTTAVDARTRRRERS